MAIDYRDVKEQWDRQDRVRPPQVEYRVLSQSAAWQQCEEDLTKQLQGLKSNLQAEIQSFLRSGHYNPDLVIKQKALLDIRQAEIRIMETVLSKLTSYRQEEMRDAE